MSGAVSIGTAAELAGSSAGLSAIGMCGLLATIGSSPEGMMARACEISSPDPAQAFDQLLCCEHVMRALSLRHAGA